MRVVNTGFRFLAKTRRCPRGKSQLSSQQRRLWGLLWFCSVTLALNAWATAVGVTLPFYEQIQRYTDSGAGMTGVRPETDNPTPIHWNTIHAPDRRQPESEHPRNVRPRPQTDRIIQFEVDLGGPRENTQRFGFGIVHVAGALRTDGCGEASCEDHLLPFENSRSSGGERRGGAVLGHMVPANEVL